MPASDVKGAFFNATKRRYDTVEVPLLGQVRIRSLTAGEIRAWRERITASEGAELQYANELLVAAAVVDDAGDRVFSDEDATSQLFADLDGAAFSVLAKAVRKHTNVEADPDWKAIEAAAKNSEATG